MKKIICNRQSVTGKLDQYVKICNRKTGSICKKYVTGKPDQYN